MIDDETFILLCAYHDGELSPGEALAMERQLVADGELRALREQLGALAVSIRDLPAPPPPAALRTRIAQRYGAGSRASPRSRPAWHALAAVALAGLTGGMVAGGGGVYLATSPGTDATLGAVVDGHLRALAAPQPFDVASSNRHVVKPWFNGRTTIAPEAPDLADQGFPLLGGRVDAVEGRSVPTLVYHHDRHTISVTVVPKTGGVPSGEERRGGSTIEHWNAADLTYWVVSDLNAKDLRSFVRLFRAQTAPAG